MSDCESIGSLVTPYVDGELPLEDRTRLERHVRVCRTCRSRVTAEQAVRDLIRARKREFESERASPVLRAACASWRQRSVNEATRSVSRRSTWRSRVGPLALAATIVLIVGGAFLYQATDRS